jgi:hypothetical protein
MTGFAYNGLTNTIAKVRPNTERRTEAEERRAPQAARPAM